MNNKYFQGLKGCFQKRNHCSAHMNIKYHEVIRGSFLLTSRKEAAKMSLSKKALSGQMEKKTLSLQDKVKLLDYKKDHPKKSCRDIAEVFKIGKTSAATILKNEDKLRKDYATFQGNQKRNRKGKYHKLNEAMFNWYSKCCAANLYPTGKLIVLFIF